MNLPDPKALKKLAAACRKAGIKTYKCGELEFTLTDDEPVSNYKAAKQKQAVTKPSLTEEAFSSDGLTEDQLLMWSVGESEEETKGNG